MCWQSSWRTLRCALACHPGTHKVSPAWHVPGSPWEQGHRLPRVRAESMPGPHVVSIQDAHGKQEGGLNWELTYLHCPAETLSILALLPQNSYQGLSFHPLVNAVLGNQLWRCLCCVFGPKYSCAIHKLKHKTPQHHSSQREEAKWHVHTHTTTCRVDISKYINTFLIIYSVYKNTASNWTCSI